MRRAHASQDRRFGNPPGQVARADFIERYARRERRQRRPSDRVDERRRLPAEIADEHRERAEEQQPDGNQQQRRRDQQRLVHAALPEEPARRRLAARAQLPEQRAADSEQHGVQIVALDERRVGGARRANPLVGQPRPRAERAGDDEHD